MTANDGPDAALSLWVTGDVDTETTRKALHAKLGRLSVSGTRVPWDAPDAETPTPEREATLRRIASLVVTRFPGQRVLVTPGDSVWTELGAEAAHDRPSWIASEPLQDEAFVVVGWDSATMNDALAILPRLARALAAIGAVDAADTDARREAHAVKNMLAGVLANVEYASFLVDPPAEPPATAPTDAPRDLLVALRNALESAKGVAPHVDELRRIAGRRGPGGVR